MRRRLADPLSHFTLRSFYRVLGKGAFGSVYAAHRLDTGKMYAIKAFQKRRLIRQDSLKLVFNERNYLERVSSPVWTANTSTLLSPARSLSLS